MDNNQNYAILGIHGEDVKSVEGNVARVRFFTGDKVTDEDIALPELLPGVPPTIETYSQLLKDDLEKRSKALEKKS